MVTSSVVLAGIIIFYEVWLRGMPGREGVPDPAEKRVFNPAGQYFPRPTVVPGERTLEPPDTEVIVDALAPFTQYELQVFSENALGKAASGWARGRTREDGEHAAGVTRGTSRGTSIFYVTSPRQ